MLPDGTPPMHGVSGKEPPPKKKNKTQVHNHNHNRLNARDVGGRRSAVGGRRSVSLNGRGGGGLNAQNPPPPTEMVSAVIARMWACGPDT